MSQYHPITQLQQLHYSPLQKVALQQFFFSVFQNFIKDKFLRVLFGIILMQIVSSEIHMQWWNLLPGHSQNLQHSIANVDGNCPRNCVEISGNPSVLDQVKGFSVFRENIDE